MALFQSTEDHTCDGCGAINVVSFTDYPDRDRYTVDCASCGQVLLSGKGSRFYESSALKEHSEKDAK